MLVDLKPIPHETPVGGAVPTTANTAKPAAAADKGYYRRVVGMTRSVLTDTYDSSLQSLNMGFALASALAWNEAVKTVIKKYFQNSQAPRYQMLYALAVTLLAAVVFIVTKAMFKPSLQRSDVKPVVGYVR